MKHTSTCSKLFSVLLLLVLSLTLLTGCKQEEIKESRQIFSMDTVMELTAYGENAHEGLAKAVAAINELNLQLDPEYEKSPVYALNQGETVSVSDQILDMLETASLVHNRSGGALNIALYPVTKTWGFLDSAYRIPEAAELETALAHINVNDITIDSDSVTLPDGMEISFGALAKGCTAEHVISLMREAGVESACISLGGNAQTLGTRPNGELWGVALLNPEDTGSAVGVIQVAEAAVVTSGDYQRFFTGEDGTLYHHIIDPATGCPTDNGLQSVTIICDNGTMADALSTAMFVLGEDGAIAYQHEFGGFEMILITHDGRVIVSAGIADHFQIVDESWNYVYLEA